MCVVIRQSPWFERFCIRNEENPMTGTFTRVGMACLGFVCLNLVGCATLHFPWEKPVPHASARNPVIQIVCLWEPSEGKDPEGKSCRGFAGQLIFLGNKGGTPVVVNGMVRVKQYDQVSGLADETEPFYQFEFDKKAWNAHLHTGTLGPTYNVFIPYMRKGNHDAQCEVQVDFVPEKAGHMVSSTVTSLVLQGKHTARETAAAKEAASMIPHTPMASIRTARTTTIPLNGGASTDTQTVDDPTAARLERMERMMQDFAAQRAANPTRSVEPEPVTAPVAAGNRFSLNERRGINTGTIQTVSHTVADSMEASIPASNSSQHRHLLSAHPLAAEENPATMNHEAQLARSPARRHPLADEPAFAKTGIPQHRNTPPATLVVPEELSDAPQWTRDDNTAGHATVGEELDGKTTQVP
jgi:hypothetical protein